MARYNRSPLNPALVVLLSLLVSVSCRLESGQEDEIEWPGWRSGLVEYFPNLGLTSDKCPVQPPAPFLIAEESDMYIEIWNDNDLPSFTVSSDNPDVAEFEYPHNGDPSWLHIVTHQPGRVHAVIISEESGELMDQLPFEVHAVGRVALHNANVTSESSILVLLGGQTPLWFDQHALEHDATLLGLDNLEYTSAGSGEDRGALEVDPDGYDGWGAWIMGTSIEHVVVNAVRSGPGVFEAKAASGTTVEVPFVVVESDHITSFNVEITAITPPEDRHYEFPTASIAAVAAIDGEYVFGLDCEWTIEVSSGEIEIMIEEPEFISLTSDLGAIATVTCRDGDLEASVEVDLEIENEG